jgi:hypothetical protein
MFGHQRLHGALARPRDLQKSAVGRGRGGGIRDEEIAVESGQLLHLRQARRYQWIAKLINNSNSNSLFNSKR